MTFTNYFFPLFALCSLPLHATGANIVIFPVLSKSQLLSASRLASILNDDGHKVTIVIPANDIPDIKPSAKFNILTYETDLSRETEQGMRKKALNMTPSKIMRGEAPSEMSMILSSRCKGILLNEAFLAKLDALEPKLAILHTMMACAAAHLSRMGIPFLDFCSVPLLPFICGGPHRIPGNPSYVPDGFFSDDEMPFLMRVANTVAGVIMPNVFLPLLLRSAESAVAEYQEKYVLPAEGYVELRRKASFLLVHGDLTFETIRPSMPKVIYIGGVQCDDPHPLDDDLREFVDESGEAGIIVFSLGGALDTDALPHGFIETFFDIFRELPQRVVWKLKKVPQHLLTKQPSNVKLVDWMPQQDLLGHPKTQLFISHGGIQGSFESICHGKAMLGVGLFGDQAGNLKILVRKGMALLVEDYTNMDPTVLKSQIFELLNDPKYARAALTARSIFRDQPQTPAQRLQHTVAYTLRHDGAHHLTSKAALRLYWFQYYLIDVFLFIGTILCLFAYLACFCMKKCWRCCCTGKRKTD